MKTVAAAALAGALFGVGLVLSGMTQADKVIGFLDVVDQWDPSLAFVMVGAIGVHLVLVQFVIRRPSPLFADVFHPPTAKEITPQLVSGATLFGLGWGLGGYCPGPGIVASMAGASNAIVFLGAMALGMAIHRGVSRG